MPTYYVDGAVGNDANAGTSEGAGNAWATIDKAANTVVAGDKVWIKASATYNELVTIDTAGGITTPIIWEGYTSTTGDGGQITIDGQSTRTYCISSSLSAATDAYNVFKNIICTGATSHGFYQLLDHNTYKNCVSHSNGGDGFHDPYNFLLFQDCTAHSNGGRGFYNGGTLLYFNCIAYGNTTEGFYTGDGTAFNCLSYNNSQHAFRMSGTTRCFFLNCTADGDGYASMANFYFSASTRSCAAINCISVGASGAGSYGFYMNSDSVENKVSVNNLVYDNTSDYGNFETFDGEITSDPSFTNQASDDYTLSGSSPCIEAGADLADFMDLGAYQYEVPAGASGGFIIG